MIKKSRFVIVYVLLLITGLYISLHKDIDVPVNRPFDQFPANHRDWRSISDTVMSGGVLDKLKPSDYLFRHYAGIDGKRVSLYVGYHGGGKESGEIHSPKHCLPGSGWFEASSRRTELDVAGRHIRLVKAVYQKGESKEMFLYWFQVRDRTLSDEYSLKLAEITSSLLHRRRDAAFVRISVPFETEEEQAFAAGASFIKDFYPVICEFLPS